MRSKLKYGSFLDAKLIYILLCISFVCINCARLRAEKIANDSLWNVVKSGKEDTSKVDAIIKVSYTVSGLGNFKKADSLIGIALKLSEKLGFEKGLVWVSTAAGNNYYNQSNFSKAIECYKKSLELAEKHGFKQACMDASYDLVSVYDDEANYPKAIEYALKTLKLAEEINDKYGIAKTYNALGLIYVTLNDTTKALDYYLKALKIKREIGNKRSEANTLSNIALMYWNSHNLPVSMEYNQQALKIREETGDKYGISASLNNIANIYTDQGKLDTALDYYMKALKLREEIGYKAGIAGAEINISSVYERKGKYKEALEYGYKALEAAKESSSLTQLQEANEGLSELNERVGNGKEALKYFKDAIALRDSAFNKENTKKIVQSEMNFEFEKKQAGEKAEQDKKDAIQKEQAHKQQIVIYFISVILLLVFGFAIFAYRSYLQKQRANKELDEKNKKIESAYMVIEEKNREITDSINYAKRIQSAMLPTRELMHAALPQSFVLFKPKAIVSGDFYFMAKQNGTTFLAAADCTGHGVPGAFMSMIGSEKLNDAVEQSRNTGDILKLLNKGIKTSLKQSNEADSTRDGMDIALVAITGSLPSKGGFKESLTQISPLGSGEATIQFSGANRPLWIIRKGRTEIEEIKPTKQAIGGFTGDDEHFEVHNVELNNGDTIYLFSDGYADQFGGTEGKKLTTKKFRELILSLQNKPMPEQEKELDAYFESWKGSREQLDDILIIGVRI